MVVGRLPANRSLALPYTGELIGTLGFLTKITGLIVAIPMLYAMLAILSGRRMLHPSRLATLGTVVVVGLAPVVAYYLWARHLALSYPPYHFAGSGNWLWDNGLRGVESRLLFGRSLSEI